MKTIPHPFNLFMILCGTTLWSHAQEMTPYRTITGALRHRADRLPEIPAAEGDAKPKVFELNLTEHFFSAGGQNYTGFKFHTPKTPGLDMVWCFQVSTDWQSWYIVPKVDKMQGFRYWFAADQLYQEFPKATSPRLFLQTLDAASLKPDQEYYIWFRTGSPNPNGAFSASMKFVPPGKDHAPWERHSIAEALNLTPAPPADQVAFLHSNGGAILLDPAFFDAVDSRERVAHMISEKGRLQLTPDGHYIPPVAKLPLLKTQPSMNEIEAKYGKPKMVITAAERASGGVNLTPEEKNLNVACYDFFGFAYDPADPGRKVREVETNPYNADELVAPRDGLTYAEAILARMHFRIFFQDGKEVGRVANWGEHGAKLISRELPTGEYRRDQRPEVLTYEGDGHWTYRSTFADGTTEWEKFAEKHAWNGPARRHYPNGNTRSEMTYKDDVLDGAVNEWDEDGLLTSRRFFENGKEKAEDK